MPPQTLSKLMRLPARERLALAERLWLSVAGEQRMPVPNEHKHIRSETDGGLSRWTHQGDFTRRADAATSCIVNRKPEFALDEVESNLRAAIAHNLSWRSEGKKHVLGLYNDTAGWIGWNPDLFPKKFEVF